MSADTDKQEAAKTKFEEAKQSIITAEQSLKQKVCGISNFFFPFRFAVVEMLLQLRFFPSKRTGKYHFKNQTKQNNTI